jgi:hypothetical protein
MPWEHFLILFKSASYTEALEYTHTTSKQLTDGGVSSSESASAPFQGLLDQEKGLAVGMPGTITITT